MDPKLLHPLPNGLSQCLSDDLRLVLVTLVSQQLTEFVVVEVACEPGFDASSIDTSPRGLGWMLRCESIIDDIRLFLVIVVWINV